jgi:hypothetical protein
MEVLFTYISGLGQIIDLPINILNQYSNEFFQNKTYSRTINRFAFIIVPKNLSTEEVNKFKTKVVGRNKDKIGVTIYLDHKQFLRNNLSANVEYIHYGIINTLAKNSRLKDSLKTYSALVDDLNSFFALIKSLGI